MTAWSDFYAARLGPRYLRHVKIKYEPFIDLVARAIRKTDTVLEVGCGMGTVTRALLDRRVGQRHICVDDDRAMLGMAVFQAGAAPNVSTRQMDIRIGTPKADIIHGHGVLEHFDDADIRAIIAAHRAAGARLAVHYVPGDKYKTPSFGDERLLPVDRWRAIAKPDAIHVFNDGYDYALVWHFT